MGGPGYLIRRETLSDHIHLLPEYVIEAKSSNIRKYLWHSDVVISLFITKMAHLGCWEHDSMSLVGYNPNVFKQHYKGHDPIHFTVTYHPLKDSGDYLEYHKQVKGL